MNKNSKALWIKGVSAIALILVAFLITSTSIYEGNEDSAIAIAVSNDNGFKIMDAEAIKEKYGANLEDHFRQTAEMKNIELDDFDLKDVEISNRDIMDGKMNYLTLNASYKDIHLTVAIPVYESFETGHLYASLEDAGILDEDLDFQCPCETNSCSGDGCSQCKFTEDAGGCVTGCMCNRSTGGGKCDHSVSQLPPGTCPPGISGPF